MDEGTVLHRFLASKLILKVQLIPLIIIKHLNQWGIRGINSSAPQRRMPLFRGVCCFSPHFVFFRAFCLVKMRKFVYLQAVKGVATICNLGYVNVNRLSV